MASVEECRKALLLLAERLSASSTRVDLDRTLACRVSDLDVAFHGRLSGGKLVDITDGDNPQAKIKLTAGSDDLVELVHGRLDVTRALASRRISVSANPFDLLKLRRML